MKTTIDIPDDVMDEAKRVARSESAQDIIIRALREFADKHDQRKLIKHLGTFEDFMTPEELNKMRSEG